MKGRRQHVLPGCLLLVGFFLLAGCDSDHHFVKRASFKGTNQITITFAGPVDELWASEMDHYEVYQKQDADILLTLSGVSLSQDKSTVTLTFLAPLDRAKHYVLSLKEIMSHGKSQGTALLNLKRFYLGHLLSILLGAMIFKNFVFTRYLGLTVFFGTSQKKSTAVGMGVTFTIVIVASAMISWFIYKFFLKPFELDFLQIVVFISLASIAVQSVDTILRKVNPTLFKELGVYLVLMSVDYIILTVPLIFVNNNYNFLESLMLAIGAGGGFLIALFLMSSVRERLETANVPLTFRGLPIAFITAGLFVLAFMGFS